MAKDHNCFLVVDPKGARFAYRAIPGRKFIVIELSVTGSTDIEGFFEAPDDLVLDHLSAQVTDTDGLEACRLGWKNDSGKDVDNLTSYPGVSVVYPALSQIAIDSWQKVAEIPPLDLVFKKNTRRSFIVQNLTGTPTYTVRLTLHTRLLREISISELDAAETAENELE